MTRRALTFVVLALFGATTAAFLFGGSGRLVTVEAQTETEIQTTIPTVIILSKGAKLG